MNEHHTRDEDNWAAPVERLSVTAEVSRYGYNVQGKRVAGPQQGFGRLWQRTYTADLGDAVTPEELIAGWKMDFGDHWPKGARFYGSMTGIKPGDVAPLATSGLATGVMVLYADDTSFTFLTPEGHIFAGMITFSGERTVRGTLAKISILIRTSDPIFESMWPLARRGEDFFWSTTLQNLAIANGVPDVVVAEKTECVDRGRLWRNWRNIRHNAVIRSVMHGAAAPFRPRVTSAAATATATDVSRP